MILSSLFCVIANAFILKQTRLFGLEVTCTDAYSVGSLLSLNLLQQFFGKEAAIKASRYCFISLICFTIFALFHLFYFPSEFDTADSHFVKILSHSPRITAASFVTFYLIQRFDIFFFAFLKKWLKKAPFSLIIILSLFVSQTFDTLLFSFLGLYGIIHSFLAIFIMSTLIKYIAILFMGPLISKMLKTRVAHAH